MSNATVSLSCSPENMRANNPACGAPTGAYGPGLGAWLTARSASGKLFAHLIYKAVNALFDFSCCFLALISAALLFGPGQTRLADVFSPAQALRIAGLALGMVFVLQLCGVYRDEKSFLNIEESKKTIKGFALAVLAGSLATLLLDYEAWLGTYLAGCLLAFGLVFYGKLALNRRLGFLRRMYGSRVLIYGAGAYGRELFNLITGSPQLGMSMVGFVDDDPQKRGSLVDSCSLYKCESARVFGGGADLPLLVCEHAVDEIVLTMPHADNESMRKVFAQLAGLGVRVSFMPGLYGIEPHKIHVDQMGGIPIASYKLSSLRFYAFIKAVIDRAAALLLLLVLAPLFAAVALAVKFDSPGPVFFTHNRVGKRGKLFKLYKFRSLSAESDPYALNPVHGADPRITRVGRFLRKSSLDELPQLFNVLFGQMSLVGPRPEMPFIVEEYDEIMRQRLNVKPGITGLWQISVDRKKAIHENMDYDLYYIHNMSFLLDLTILFETAAFVFRGI